MDYGEQLYGESQYGITQDIPTPEELQPDLMAYLPSYYHNSRVMSAVLEVQANEFGKLKYALYDVLRQLFVDTATWGLDLWERELGIKTEPLKNYINRRSVIKAKLRGYGTTTVEMIKRVAAAYSGGEVEVVEYPAEYRFVVKFVGTRGIPPNMQDLTRTIEQIKPAHQAFSYAYTYLVWQEAQTYTWTSASIMIWDELRNSPPS